MISQVVYVCKNFVAKSFIKLWTVRRRVDLGPRAAASMASSPDKLRHLETPIRSTFCRNCECRSISLIFKYIFVSHKVQYVEKI